MTPLLLIEQLSLRFSGQAVLRQLDLTLYAGEVVSVLGSNGAGKSTLLKSILGLHAKKVQPSGKILIAGLDIAQASAQALSQLAYVPEQPAVYPHLSAIENIRYFLSLCDQKSVAINDCLSMVGLPEHAWKQPCSTYSKGMRQKVMLAFALAKQAKLLLLDEPNSGLDPQATEELNQLIMQCKQQAMGVLVVTHDVLSAMAFSDRLLMLAHGQLQAVSLDPDTFSLAHLKRLYQGQATA